MKKIINENTLKSIIRESLKSYLKESLESKLGAEESSEGWTPEIGDMWDEINDGDANDDGGAFGNLAQGEDNANEFASDDNSEYLREKMFESVVKDAVNKAFANVVNESSKTGKKCKKSK